MASLRDLIQQNNLTGTYQEIAIALNIRPQIDNPAPQSQIRAATMESLFALIPPTEKAALIANRDFSAWIASVFLSVAALPDGEDKTKYNAAANLLVQRVIESQDYNRTRIQVLASLQSEIESLKSFAALLAFDGTFSADTIALLLAELERTIPDPNYQAKVAGRSLAEAAGISPVPVMPHHVQIALNF
jgi:uncharacterized small protein (DUF1192 family)